MKNVEKPVTAPEVAAILAIGVAAGLETTALDDKEIASKLCTEFKVKPRKVSFDLKDASPVVLMGLALQGAEILAQRVIAKTTTEVLTQETYDQKVQAFENRLRGLVPWNQKAPRKSDGKAAKATYGDEGFDPDHAGFLNLVNAMLAKRGVAKDDHAARTKAINDAKASDQLPIYQAIERRKHEAQLLVNAQLADEYVIDESKLA
jgi:hypothetical protein